LKEIAANAQSYRDKPREQFGTWAGKREMAPPKQVLRQRDYNAAETNQKGAASGPRPFKLYVTDELASLTNRVARGRKNIAAANKFCYFSASPQSPCIAIRYKDGLTIFARTMAVNRPWPRTSSARQRHIAI